MTPASRYFAASLALLAVAGCKSSKPYGGDGTGAGGEVDYTNISDLPQRGNFNPETDVDYATLQAPGLECGTIYFATDSTTIQAGERAKLGRVASWMNESPDKSVLVAGHCDERGTLEYNRALGERRAIAVRDYLLGLGIPSSRVYSFTYGEERPAVEGSHESAWAKNRRAEIGVVKK